MANTKISGLTNGDPALSTDLIPIDRSGSNFAISAGSIAFLYVSLFTKTWYTTSQRAPSTVYQNTTGKPIIVIGWLVGSNSDIQILCDASSTPTTVILDQYANAGFGTNFYFMVPNNYYYELSGSGITPEAWVEWQINTGTVTFSGELSGSRALSTVYQNTSGNAMLVLADLSSVGGGTTIQAISDSNASPSDVVWQSDGVSSGSQTIFFMVPNNHYYKVTCSGASVAHWNEYSLPFSAVRSTDYSASGSPRKLITNSAKDANGVQVNLSKDIFYTVSVTPTQTGSLLLSSAYTMPPGFAPYDILTMSNNNSQRDAGSLIAQPGEFYIARQDSNTNPVLNHWWEYTLG